MWQSFVCAMTAAVALQAFDPFRSGKLVLYQVTYSTGWHDFELIPFAMLGIFGVSNSYPSLSLTFLM
jgi:chloride channel 3/4/5